jgi:hypothetical protein
VSDSKYKYEQPRCTDSTLIYQSSTHGPIPLSFTGKRLLANERDAATAAIEHGSFTHNDSALSKARGDLAAYMSKLEGKQNIEIKPTIFGVDWGAQEARVFAHFMNAHTTIKTPEQRACDELLEAAAEFNEAATKLNRCTEQAQHVGLVPTWRYANPKSLMQTKPRKRFEFPEIAVEVSRTVKTERVVVEETTVVMGREP